MKSRVYFINSTVSLVRRFAREISNDRISVYAAQASFFTIISSIPFISLLFALSAIFIPEGVPDILSSLTIPSGVADIVERILSELQTAPNVSLLSLSAFTTLWSASRGIAAVRVGIETVYKAEIRENFVAHRLNSIVTTLIFIVILTSSAALLLFGDTLARMLGVDFFGIFMRLRSPFFITVMSVTFTAMYSSIARRSQFIRKNAALHIPGAVFSSLGWVVFSYFYSVYITNFPSASYIYGSLAAVCLIMLWVYFCMMILLLGAEVNKMYFAGINASNK